MLIKTYRNFPFEFSTFKETIRKRIENWTKWYRIVIEIIPFSRVLYYLLAHYTIVRVPCNSLT